MGLFCCCCFLMPPFHWFIKFHPGRTRYLSRFFTYTKCMSVFAKVCWVDSPWIFDFLFLKNFTKIKIKSSHKGCHKFHVYILNTKHCKGIFSSDETKTIKGNNVINLSMVVSKKIAGWSYSEYCVSMICTCRVLP